MKIVLAALALFALSFPAMAADEGPRGGGSRADAQAQAPANRPQPLQGRGPGRDGGLRGRVNPSQVQPQAAPVPNVVQERARRGPNPAQLAPRQGGPGANFAENRDRGRDDRDRGRDFRNDRGRDSRGDRDSGRFFQFRGRDYAAMRGPAFSYPRGWGYRHWGRGEYLPSVFLAAPFFFDYDRLGLPPPPPRARWVRNGPDALLISTYDGRIIDVIYDAFY